MNQLFKILILWTLALPALAERVAPAEKVDATLPSEHNHPDNALSSQAQKMQKLIQELKDRGEWDSLPQETKDLIKASKDRDPVSDSLIYHDIQSRAYPCGLPISDLANILTHIDHLTDNEKGQLMQIAIDFNHCCSSDTALWPDTKKFKQALAYTCALKQTIDDLTFVNALKSADFFSTCPSLVEYIDTMTEFLDSRLGVLLIIDKAQEQKCDSVQLHKIKAEVEEDREKLWQGRYNIDYREFDASDDY